MVKTDFAAYKPIQLIESDYPVACILIGNAYMVSGHSEMVTDQSIEVTNTLRAFPLSADRCYCSRASLMCKVHPFFLFLSLLRQRL